MSSKQAEQLYCSLDLEFTGFDPEKDQILEIGFAIFQLTETGRHITEQWSQVFKPTVEVHPKILGLTGITQAELDEAPDFEQHKDFLQDKLGQVTIVGHNPVLDIKFLQSYGLVLTGPVIDTLELVQFILPTHHSYNLENLVHYFGIEHGSSKGQTVPGAHRALGDAISTIAVLENLIRLYQNFPETLRSDLSRVIERGQFAWQEIIAQRLPAKMMHAKDSLAEPPPQTQSQFRLSDNLVTIDLASGRHELNVAIGLKDSQSGSEEILLGVSSPSIAMQLWRQKLVHAVFQPQDTFSTGAFEQFLERAVTSEELRFCLKVLTWLHTNWQTEVVLDLNISFFGGQFRQFIVGGQPKIDHEQILCADYATLQTLIKNPVPEIFGSRRLVICDLQQFEQFLGSGASTRLSWLGTLYSLRAIYNPETDFGSIMLRDKVTKALVSTDLFFGLVVMSLRPVIGSQEYLTLDFVKNNHNQIYTRLQKAAGNLALKLSAIYSEESTPELARIIEFLQNFFLEQAGRVKWINLGEKNLAFFDQPIDIAPYFKEIAAPFVKVQFTETITQPELLSYLVDRLGLDTASSEFVEQLLPNNLIIAAQEDVLEQAALFDLITKSALPVVVVFPELEQVKSFYNNYYPAIKPTAALFAESYSGGGNKMFRNFSIKENSILLGTPEFIAKQNHKLAARSVIFTGLPVLQSSHPYVAALLEHWHSRYPRLAEILQVSKILAVLKQLKIHGSTTAVVYGAPKKFPFVDKGH
jgi:DNA polymerase III epsilon subunit-like protein